MIVAPRGRSPRLALRAAGFIATSTSGRSPGVRTLWSAKWSWKLDTPGSVPCGARISAGKFGSVDRSFPTAAVSEVNRSPVSCIPSPESPANRMTTRSRVWTVLLVTVGALRVGGGWRLPHGAAGAAPLIVRRGPVRFTPVLRNSGARLAAMEGYLAAAAVLLAGVLLVTAAMVVRRLVAPRAVTEAGLRTYESGVDPVGTGWAQSQVRYISFAFLYVVFAVDAVYL